MNKPSVDVSAEKPVVRANQGGEADAASTSVEAVPATAPAPAPARVRAQAAKAKPSAKALDSAVSAAIDTVTAAPINSAKPAKSGKRGSSVVVKATSDNVAKAAAPAEVVKAAAAKAPTKVALKPGGVKPVAAKAASVVSERAPDTEKAVKEKLVRDSFTMPESEYEQLRGAKKACLKAGVDIKKSELLRIGVAMIGRADVATL